MEFLFSFLSLCLSLLGMATKFANSGFHQETNFLGLTACVLGIALSAILIITSTKRLLNVSTFMDISSSNLILLHSCLNKFQLAHLKFYFGIKLGSSVQKVCTVYLVIIGK